MTMWHAKILYSVGLTDEKYKVKNLMMLSLKEKLHIPQYCIV